MASPRGGVFEGEKYLIQAESLLSQLEVQKQSAQVDEKVNIKHFMSLIYDYVIIM